MFYYLRSKKDFLIDIEKKEVINYLEDGIKQYGGEVVKKGEIDSWKSSIECIKNVIEGLDDNVYVGMEFHTEGGTKNRIDIMLAGYGKNKKKNIIVFELKQYSKIVGYWKEKDRVAYINQNNELKIKYYNQEKEYYISNPLSQLKKYVYSSDKEKRGFFDYNKNIINGRIHLYPILYMHNHISEPINEDDVTIKDNIDDYNINYNYDKNELLNLLNGPLNTSELNETDCIMNKRIINTINRVKVYFGGKEEKDELIKYLKKILCETSSELNGKMVFNELKKGEPSCNLKLYNVVDKILSGEDNIILMSQQRDVLNEIKDQIGNNEGRILFHISGGPGSGKSILGLKIMKELMGKGIDVKFVIPISAPKKAYTLNVDEETAEKFVYPSEIDINGKSILIVDEAHGCNNKFIEKVVENAKICVFLSDVLQCIDKKDCGVINDIVKKNNVKELKLWTQFRCNKDDGYVSWVEKFLQIGSNNYPFKLQDLDFDVEIVTVQKRLKELLQKKCVVTAFKLSKRSDNEPFQISKNITMKYYYYISEEENRSGNFIDKHYDDRKKINYIGKISDIQGLETKEVVVIIGDELGYCNNEIIINKDENITNGDREQIRKRLEAKTDDEALKYIKNIYRILLTRGLKKCYIYCMDENLRKYLKGL